MPVNSSNHLSFFAYSLNFFQSSKAFFAFYLTKLAVLFGMVTHAYAHDSEFAKLNLNNSIYGVSGDNPALIEFAKYFKERPQISVTGKSLLTFNKTGFDILDAQHLDSNWVIQNFLDACGEEKVVLDIGGGFGALTKAALSKGTTVVYSDKSYKNVMVGYKEIESQYHPKLYLNDEALPYTNLPKESFDAIIAHRVLHFLTPQEMEQTMVKFSEWLKPNGKLYIVVLSPTHVAYKQQILPQYEARWEMGNHWPGYPLDVKKSLPNQAYNLPDALHVMDERPLKRCLEKNNFLALKYDYISTKTLGVETNRDGKENFGIVAQKKIKHAK